jgi:carboxylesterase type B
LAARIYGGAYVLGDKNGIYNATPIVRLAQGTLIHVTGNYRLGPFGFLGGTTIEKDSTATPNAGFHDQRAVLEWIHKYIVSQSIIEINSNSIYRACLGARPKT